MKLIRKKNILRSMITGNLIALVIPVIIIGSLIILTLYSYFDKDIPSKDNIIAVNMAKNIDGFIHEAVHTLDFIAITLNIEIKENREIHEINNSIDEINSINNFFQSIEVVDSNGIVQYTLPSNSDQIDFNRSGHDYFNHFKFNNEVYWSNPFICPTNGKPTVTVAIPSNGRIIVGYLNLDYLNNLTKENIIDNRGNLEISVIDNYGVFIANKDQNLVQQRQIEQNFVKIKDIASKSENYLQLRYNGKKMLVTSVEISSFDWYLIVYDDYTLSFKKINNMIALLVFLLIVCVFVFIVLCILMAVRMTKDIDNFVRQTEIIAKGELEVILEKQSYEEFDKLANNFNVMIESINERDNKLEKMAYHDSLTGLKNRAYLYEKLWTDSYKNSEMIGFIYLDVDNFKYVNDTYGHFAGDELLVELSHRLKNCMNDDHRLIRLGGDEFIFLAMNIKNKQNIDTIIEEIRQSIKEPIQCMNRSIYITISMGISIYPDDGIDFDTLLKCSDTAMYVAKAQGKNTSKYFDHSMNEKIIKRMNIDQYLRSALENEELYVVYQPQIDVKNDCIRGFEALLRWSNPKIGIIDTMDFISIAEESGMIVKIGEWVTKIACTTIKIINEKYNKNYIMAINVSPVELRKPDYIDSINNIIKELDIKPEWLEFEITENVFIDSMDNVITTLNRLKSLGIRISLDDFGTGYSSLSYINKLPLNTLKIDREFTNNLSNKIDSKNMIESIIIMAHKLGISVIAEGVESAYQFNILKELYCDDIQGYYFSKAIILEELIRYIENKEVI